MGNLYNPIKNEEIMVVSCIFPGDEEKASYLHNNFDIIKENETSDKKKVTILIVFTVEGTKENIQNFKSIYESYSSNNDDNIDYDKGDIKNGDEF